MQTQARESGKHQKGSLKGNTIARLPGSSLSIGDKVPLSLRPTQIERMAVATATDRSDSEADLPWKVSIGL